MECFELQDFTNIQGQNIHGAQKKMDKRLYKGKRWNSGGMVDTKMASIDQRNLFL